VLDHIGVFLDDRPSSFDLWLERKLDGIAAGIRRDVEAWARLLHDGGPRSQPRDVHTVWGYLNRIRPVLLEWSNRYDHLREVTRHDIRGHLSTVHGTQRKHTLVALRSLFARAKKNGTIFKNPTSRIRVGQQEHDIIQPLAPGTFSPQSPWRPGRRTGWSSPSRPSTPPALARSAASNSTISTSATADWLSTAESGPWMS
jgi:hypothetical protein